MTPALNLSTLLLVLLIPVANYGNNILKIYLLLPKIFKTFIKDFLEDFFHLPPVSTTPVGALSCEYLEFSKKFETALRGTRGLGGN